MMIERTLSQTERKYLALVLAVVVLFVGVDLFTDSKEGVQINHLLVELSLAVAGCTGLFILLRDSFHKSRELTFSKEILIEKEKETERWKLESKKFIKGLSVVIDAQLDRWSLTPSEKEITLLLLKGLSLREIAEVRQTNEKTVRAQCVSVYSKSGMSGRSALSAFFLEDLLLPSENISTE